MFSNEKEFVDEGWLTHFMQDDDDDDHHQHDWQWLDQYDHHTQSVLNKIFRANYEHQYDDRKRWKSRTAFISFLVWLPRASRLHPSFTCKWRRKDKILTQLTSDSTFFARKKFLCRGSLLLISRHYFCKRNVLLIEQLRKEACVSLSCLTCILVNVPSWLSCLVCVCFGITRGKKKKKILSSEASRQQEERER